MAVVDREEQNISSMVDHVVHIPTVDEPISPLLSLPPVQLYSVCLAAERIAGGYERPALS
jgi:glucosamine 6-phosphate synthetase-like amidotransferase/phosphosugar isomerase protein